MGVLPAGNGSSLDQILSNVLGSIGLNSSDASNENNPPFTNLRNIVQSLENQVNTLTGSSVMESPIPETSNYVELLGRLTTRLSSLIARVQPHITQVGNELSNESSNTSNREDTQNNVRQLAPLLQQLSSALAVVSTSLQSVRMGSSPGEATANDTSSDTHRSFVGPQGNVSVHIASVNGSDSNGSPVNISNLVQGIVGSMRNRSGNTQQPSTNPTPNTGNQASGNNSSSSNAQNVPSTTGLSDLLSAVNSMRQEGVIGSNPPVFGGQFGGNIENALNNIQNVTNGRLDTILPLLLSWLGERGTESTLASVLQIENSIDRDDPLYSVFMLFLSKLKVSDLVDITRQNWSSVESLHKPLSEHITTLMGNDSIDEYSSKIISVIRQDMNEDLLPQEILSKKKSGYVLTDIATNTLEKRLNLLIKGILANYEITDTNPYPFSTFITNWSRDTTGVLITNLSEGLNGGESDALALTRYFIAQRLYILDSTLGPLSTLLLDSLIGIQYKRYKDNQAAKIDYRKLSQSEIDEIIEKDVEIQSNSKKQPPFSDIYLTGKPMPLRRPIVLPNCNPGELFTSHIKEGITSSGVAGGNESNFERTLGENNTLEQLYVEQLRKSLSDRVNNDPDFDPKKFPNAKRILKD